MSSIESGREVVDRLLAGSRVAPERHVVAGQSLAPENVVRRLEPFVTEERRERIEAVLDDRTYAVATVVEGLVNSGNVSAVMRSAEALGFQRLDVVTGSTSYKHSSRTTQGAEKWLDVRVWEDAASCVRGLKLDGYRVVVTHLDDTAEPIGTIDFTERVALVFGNELDGVSDAMLDLADARCIVPMAGFVRSFNISVAAGVALYHAYHDRVERLGRSGDLSDREKARLRAAFYVRSVRNGERVLQRSVEEERHD